MLALTSSKVGIGPGSVCTTRKMTGVGYPQLSAIIECADAAHGLSGRICADGGCTVPGDIAKAFGGGADFVMLGGMLAGHDESAGELVEVDGKPYKRFYGMSSKNAMDKYAGGVAKYRAAEGKSVLIPARGPVEDTVQAILGGVRSACTYVGARRLEGAYDADDFYSLLHADQRYLWSSALTTSLCCGCRRNLAADYQHSCRSKMGNLR